jgi:hypothetical protein
MNKNKNLIQVSNNPNLEMELSLKFLALTTPSMTRSCSLITT